MIARWTTPYRATVADCLNGRLPQRAPETAENSAVHGGHRPDNLILIPRSRASWRSRTGNRRQSGIRLPISPAIA
jgi:hypothetical protein